MSKDYKPFKFASFSSVSDHNIKKLGSSSSCPWRVIGHGLSVSGKCKNS